MREREATPAAEGSVELTDFTETLPLGEPSFWITKLLVVIVDVIGWGEGASLLHLF